MIRITFLGTVSGVPSKERNHPALVIEYFAKLKDTLLFDCGEGTQFQFMRSGISFMDVDRIFITHWHADHFAGLIPLIQTMNLEQRRKPLKIFAPEANRFVPTILSLGYFGLRFPVQWKEVPHFGKEIVVVEETEDWQVLSIPVKHSVPAVAYCFKERDRWKISPSRLAELGLKRGRWLRELKRLGTVKYKGKVLRLEDVAMLKPGFKIVYSGDTKPCANVIKLAKEADVLIHDGTFLEESELKAHTAVTQAAKLAKEAKVKELILTHISRRYIKVDELEQKARSIFPSTKIAHDLMQIELK